MKNRRSTRQNYLSVWRSFNDFFLRLDRKPDCWEDRIILFVGYMVDCNKKSTTIRSYLSAIRSILADDGVILNENKCLLNALTKASRLNNSKVRMRLPIHKNLLFMLLKYIPQVFDKQYYLSVLYTAMFSTAYYGLFRVGELTKGSHPILAEDVHIGDNKRKIMFVLHSSKTHSQSNKPQVVKICGDDEYWGTQEKCNRRCPFKAVTDYAEIRPNSASPTEPFFVFQDRSPVTPVQMRSTLRSVLSAANLDPLAYGTHGFRAGRAGDLHRKGISVETIRKLGRWSSSAIYTYLMNL